MGPLLSFLVLRPGGGQFSQAGKCRLWQQTCACRVCPAIQWALEKVTPPAHTAQGEHSGMVAWLTCTPLVSGPTHELGRTLQKSGPTYASLPQRAHQPSTHWLREDDWEIGGGVGRVGREREITEQVLCIIVMVKGDGDRQVGA